MPWIDDPFQDVTRSAEVGGSSTSPCWKERAQAVDEDATPSSWPRSHVDQRMPGAPVAMEGFRCFERCCRQLRWELDQPISTFLPLLETRRNLKDAL